MKKLVITLVVAVTTFIQAQAQSAGGEVKVKVNLELNPFQSISIGTGASSEGDYGDQVTLRYSSLTDYKEGVRNTVEDQLLVSSVGSGYTISAAFKSGGTITSNFIPGTNAGSDPINIADILEIKVGNISSTTTPLSYVFGDNTASSSVIDQSLPVTYIGKPITASSALGKLFASNAQAKYSVDVVYTIAAN